MDHNTYQKRLAAMQELIKEVKEYGRTIQYNSTNGSVTVFHGTSKNLAEKIRKDGFQTQTFFAFEREGAEYYAKEKHKDGIVLEVQIDPSFLEIASAGQELYSPYSLIQGGDGVYVSGGRMYDALRGEEIEV